MNDLTPQAIGQRIAQHRTAEVTLTVTGPDGKPLANTAVVIQQLRHQFLFGCNAFRIDTANTAPKQKAYEEHFAALLNFATLPFYWGGYEPTEGQPAAARLTMMARWCAAHGIRTKGHPLCWHQAQPKWLDAKPLDDLQALQMGRIGREVRGFAGLIDTWDVVNEAVVMPGFTVEKNPIPALCRQLGPLGLLRETFGAARKANPTATLLLNDFDTSAKYEQLIEQALAAGVEIDAIGIQSHMHGGYWGAAKAWDVCQRFGRFGKPLHFTELTIISAPPKADQRWFGPAYTDWPSTPDGEVRQAREVAEFYTVLFSHPSVQAITWWDFTDDAAWLGAPSGLLHQDMTPKPAYEALQQLINRDWWTTEVRATTDSNGGVKFGGFLGHYAVAPAPGSVPASAPNRANGEGAFDVDRPGKLAAAVKLAS